MNHNTLQPDQFPSTHQELMLLPGNPEVLQYGNSLAGPSENIEKFGLGFDAELRGVIQLSPHDDGQAAESLYIFDRGEDAGFGTIANLDTDKSNVFLRKDQRYVVFTEYGLNEIKNASLGGYSVKHREGWKAFTTGESVVIGRTNENLRTTLSNQVSGGHLGIKFLEDGSIVVQDNHSTNGTRLITPTQPASLGLLPEVTQSNDNEPDTDISNEVIVGNNIMKIEGVYHENGRGHSYIFNSKDSTGKERQFIVYKSQSEGGWRASQGVEDRTKRFLKGGEHGRGSIDHYTQETQLHPQLENIIRHAEAQKLPLEFSYSHLPLAKFSQEEAMNAQKDFSDQVRMLPFPDNKLYEELWKIRAGELSASYLAPRLGFSTASSTESLKNGLMNQIDKINILLENSDVVPDFNTPVAVSYDEHPVLGKVTKETFVINTGGRPVEWIIGSADDGRKVWIDRIRLNDTQPSAYGTDSEIIDSAFLTSKPLEYREQCEVVPDNLKVAVPGTSYMDITPFLALLSPVKKYKEAKVRR